MTVPTTRSLYRAVDLRAVDDRSNALSLWTTVPAAIAVTGLAGLAGSVVGSFLVLGAGFFLAWVGAALVTRRSQLGTLLMWAPLVYAATAVAASARRAVFGSENFSVRDLAVSLFERLVLDAPALVLTMVVLLVVWGVRRTRG